MSDPIRRMGISIDLTGVKPGRETAEEVARQVSAMLPFPWELVPVDRTTDHHDTLLNAAEYADEWNPALATRIRTTADLFDFR